MLTKIEQYIGVSEFRADIAKYLKHASKKPLVVSTKASKYPFVILSSLMYNKLIEAYENTKDAQTLSSLKKVDDGVRVEMDDLI